MSTLHNISPFYTSQMIVVPPANFYTGPGKYSDQVAVTGLKGPLKIDVNAQFGMVNTDGDYIMKISTDGVFTETPAEVIPTYGAMESYVATSSLVATAPLVYTSPNLTLEGDNGLVITNIRDTATAGNPSQSLTTMVGTNAMIEDSLTSPVTLHGSTDDITITNSDTNVWSMDKSLTVPTLNIGEGTTTVLAAGEGFSGFQIGASPSGTYYQIFTPTVTGPLMVAVTEYDSSTNNSCSVYTTLPLVEGSPYLGTLVETSTAYTHESGGYSQRIKFDFTGTNQLNAGVLYAVAFTSDPGFSFIYNSGNPYPSGSLQTSSTYSAGTGDARFAIYVSETSYKGTISSDVDGLTVTADRIKANGVLNISSNSVGPHTLFNPTNSFNLQLGTNTSAFNCLSTWWSYVGNGSLLNNFRVDFAGVGGILYLYPTKISSDLTADSTSTTTGALVLAGGAAVGKNLYVGTGLSIAGSVPITGYNQTDATLSTNSQYKAVSEYAVKQHVATSSIAQSTGVHTFTPSTLLTAASTTTITIGAGGGYYVDYSTKAIEYRSWSEITPIALTYLTTYDGSWIYLDFSVQPPTVYQSPFALCALDRRRYCKLGRVTHFTLTSITGIYIMPSLSETSYDAADLIESKIITPCDSARDIFTPVGVTLPLSIKSSGGAFIRMGAGVTVSRAVPHIATTPALNPVNFYYIVYNSSTDNISITSGPVSVLDVTQYNDSDAGSLSTMAPNTFKVDTMIEFPYANSTPVVFIMYGNRTYSTFALAQADTDLYRFNSIPARLGGYVKSLIVMKKSIVDLAASIDTGDASLYNY